MSVVMNYTSGERASYCGYDFQQAAVTVTTAATVAASAVIWQLKRASVMATTLNVVYCLSWPRSTASVNICINELFMKGYVTVVI